VGTYDKPCLRDAIWIATCPLRQAQYFTDVYREYSLSQLSDKDAPAGLLSVQMIGQLSEM